MATKRKDFDTEAETTKSGITNFTDNPVTKTVEIIFEDTLTKEIVVPLDEAFWS